MRNWSELPLEIIHMISARIDNPFDLIHFRSVCSWWRSSSLPTFRPIPSLRCPLPPDVGGCGDDCHILRSRVYLITSLSSVPHRFWLFKLQEEENGELALQWLFSRITSSTCGGSYPSLSLDLLNSQVIELAQEHVARYTYWSDLFDDEGYPSNGEDRIGFVQLDPENKEFMILGTLFSRGLGMYRSYEERWTEIKTTPNIFLEALASFNGHFYSIERTGLMKVVKPSLEVNSFHRSRPCDKTRKRWLVKSGDKLLLVEMCTETRNEYFTPSLLEEKGWFEVSELDEERNDWIQVEDVGGRVLFLDFYCSFSCLPTQIPGFRPNSIIFVNIFGGYEHDRYQVYEFGKQGFRSLGDISEYVQLFPSPLWIISNA
ncbi:putative F-box/kelch-repeat protein At5g24040 [Capsella rubella]|uniref:putative F-box/kelch-repeat protein At5g24040 n=1 Tax=Capsella rubella TaxID=81985 RepID=UPI000CD4E2E0|nr:putative F-box/kelch-repeat protein At5g24040 [Capsella rubella]